MNLRLPVFWLRIRYKSYTWSTQQAGHSPEDAFERYKSGYDFSKVDVSDYKLVSSSTASQSVTEKYYSKGGDKKE